ncbi:hypothetical protein ACFQYP_21625 [Nonomuraea antimicrobica]
MVRAVPGGMTIPVAQDPGSIPSVIDPRQVEFEAGFFPNTLREDPVRPMLVSVVTAQLKKMVGHAPVEEREGELDAQLSEPALLTALARQSGRDGATIPQVARDKVRHRGIDLNVKARLSDLTVVAGPFEGSWARPRETKALNAALTRGRPLPLGMAAGSGGGMPGLGYGMSAGAQSSESIATHHGARIEEQMFEKGKLYTVRLRVDYDLTFQRVKLQDGHATTNVDNPVHLPGASRATVQVTLFGEHLQELYARMEAGVRRSAALDHLPQFRFRPARSRSGLIRGLQDARVAARERGEVALVRVHDSHGVHDYRAAPDGTISSEKPDGGFAEAFATLPASSSTRPSRWASTCGTSS